MKPRLDALPLPQRRFWPAFSQLPKHFVLYGGRTIAWRLGGRQSVDFDFFTNQPISADVREYEGELKAEKEQKAPASVSQF